MIEVQAGCGVKKIMQRKWGVVHGGSGFLVRCRLNDQGNEFLIDAMHA